MAQYPQLLKHSVPSPFDGPTYLLLWSATMQTHFVIVQFIFLIFFLTKIALLMYVIHGCLLFRKEKKIQQLHYCCFLCLQILHLVEQLCLALNDEFRTYLPVLLPYCIQVLNDAERCNDFSYVPDILHTLEVFGGAYTMLYLFSIAISL